MAQDLSALRPEYRELLPGRLDPASAYRNFSASPAADGSSTTNSTVEVLLPTALLGLTFDAAGQVVEEKARASLALTAPATPPRLPTHPCPDDVSHRPSRPPPRLQVYIYPNTLEAASALGGSIPPAYVATSALMLSSTRGVLAQFDIDTHWSCVWRRSLNNEGARVNGREAHGARSRARGFRVTRRGGAGCS